MKKQRISPKRESITFLESTKQHLAFMCSGAYQHTEFVLRLATDRYTKKKYFELLLPADFIITTYRCTAVPQYRCT